MQPSLRPHQLLSIQKTIVPIVPTDEAIAGLHVTPHMSELQLVGGLVHLDTCPLHLLQQKLTKPFIGQPSVTMTHRLHHHGQLHGHHVDRPSGDTRFARLPRDFFDT